MLEKSEVSHQQLVFLDIIFFIFLDIIRVKILAKWFQIFNKVICTFFNKLLWCSRHSANVSTNNLKLVFVYSWRGSIKPDSSVHVIQMKRQKMMEKADKRNKWKEQSGSKTNSKRQQLESCSNRRFLLTLRNGRRIWALVRGLSKSHTKQKFNFI